MSKKYTTDNITISEALNDGSGVGTSGQVLSSTGSGVSWIDGSGIVGGPYLALSGGTLTGNVRLNDSVQLQIGSSNDAYIIHNGTNTYFVNGVGNLEITNDTNDGDIIFKSDNGSGGLTTYIQIDGSTGAVDLNHYGTKKLETTSTGVEVTGNLDTTGSVSIPDAGKLYLGSGDDLHVYHAGTHGYVLNKTGDLYLMSQVHGGDIIFKTENSSGTAVTPLTLDSAGAATFAGSITTTSASGITIDTTGNAVLELDGASGNTEAIIFKHSGTEVSRISHSNSTDLVFSTGSSVATALTLSGLTTTFAGSINLPTTKYLRFTSASSNSDATVLFGNTSGTGGSLTFKRNSDSAAILTLNGDKSATFAGVLALPDGSTAAPSIGNTGDTNTGMYWPGNHQVGFAVNGSRKMYMSETKTYFQNQANGVEINNGLTVVSGGIGVTGNSTFAGDMQVGTSNANYEAGFGVTIADKVFTYGAEFQATNADIQIVLGRNNGTSVQGTGAIGASATNAFHVYDTSSVVHLFQVAQSSGDATFAGDISTSGNIYLNNNKTIFSKNTSGSNYGLLTITSGNVIKLGAYAYTSAATEIGLGDNGKFLIGTAEALSINSSKNATFAGNVTVAGGQLYVQNVVNPLIYLNDTNAGAGIFQQEGDTTRIGSDSDTQVVLVQNNATAVTIDTSKNATFAGNLEVQGADVTITANVIHAGDVDTYFGFNANNSWRVVTGGSERFKVAGDVHVTGSTDFAIPAGRKLYLDGQSNTYITESSADTIKFFTGGSEALLLNSSQNATFAGKVGIGIVPVELLDIQSASGDARIRLDAPSGSDTEVKFFNAGVAQYTIGHDDATDNFVIGGANVDAPLVSVGKTGNVGILNTSPSSKVHIGSNSTSGALGIGLQNDQRFYTINTDGGSLTFKDESAAAERMRITSAGNVSIKAPTASGGGVLNLENTTIAVNGQDWGSLNFISNDTSTGASGIRASLVGTATSFLGDGNLVFSTAPSGGTVTEAMRITSTGNVGIGVTPTEKLDVYGNIKLGTTANSNILNRSDTHWIQYNGGSTTNNTYMRVAAPSAASIGKTISFFTDAVQRMTVDATGHIGIGTSSPTARLDVLTNSATGDNDIDRYVRFRADNGEQRFAFNVGRSGNNSSLKMYNSTETQTVNIASGGNSYFNGGDVGIGLTAPEAKLHISGRVYQDGLGNSTFFGFGAGKADDLSSRDNSAFGYQALYTNTTGSSNTATGYKAIYTNTTGHSNTVAGYLALYTNTTGALNTATGAEALRFNTTGNYNTADGYSTLRANTTGGYNTATGYSALYSNTTASYNTASGMNALYANTTGVENAAFGYEALRNTTTASYNSSFGTQALRSNITGYKNTAIGSTSMYANTTGYANTAAGYLSLRYNTTGHHNTAVGFQALRANTTASYNTAVGRDALVSNTTGGQNVAIGYESMHTNTTGSYSVGVGFRALKANTASQGTALGYEALLSNTSGANNVAIGFEALKLNTTGADNTAIGHQAGNSESTATKCVFIGKGADVGGTGTSNQIVIGWGAEGNGSNTVTLGDSNTTEGVFAYGAYQEISDQSVKENVVTIAGAVNKVKAMRGVTYNKIGREATKVGVIAQEMELVLPEVVAEGSGGLKSVAYGNIVAVLIEAMKEQQIRIEALEEQLFNQ